MNIHDFISVHDESTNLSDAEILKVNKSRGCCPDCSNDLLDGPRAGEMHNVKCCFCGHEFNLCFWGTEVIFGHRLERDSPDLYGGGLFSRWYHGKVVENEIPTIRITSHQETADLTAYFPAPVAEPGQDRQPSTILTWLRSFFGHGSVPKSK